MNKMRLGKKAMLSCVMAGTLAAVNIPAIPAAAAADTVYVSGSGSMEYSGMDAEHPLNSIYSAQELLTEGGTIVVTGSFVIPGDRTYSLNEGVTVRASDTLEGPVFEVLEGGKLSLNNIVINGNDSTVILNNGEVHVGSGTVLQSQGTWMSAAGAVETGRGAATYAGDVLLEGSPVAEETEEQSQAGGKEDEQPHANPSEKEGTESGGNPGSQEEASQSGTESAGTDMTESGSQNITTGENMPGDVEEKETENVQSGQTEHKEDSMTGEENAQTQTEEWKPGNSDPGKESGTQGGMGTSGNGESTGQQETEEKVQNATVDTQKSQEKENTPETEKTVHTETGADKGENPVPGKTEQSPAPESEANDVHKDKQGGTEEIFAGIGKLDSVTRTSRKVQEEERAPAAPGKAFEEAAAALEVHSREDIRSVLAASRLYEEMSEREQAAVSEESLMQLASAQEIAYAYNHTQLGVSVSGNIPWYVQLRVRELEISTKEEKGLQILVPYELELWDLYKDQVYLLPEGERVTVSMPIPDAEIEGDFTILHYKSDGSIESIIPVIQGNRMSFETSTFSPFSIAGSTVIAGIGMAPAGEGGEDTSASGSGGSGTVSSSQGSSSKEETKETEGTGTEARTSEQSASGQNAAAAANTADETRILPMLLLALAALLVLAGARKRRTGAHSR